MNNAENFPVDIEMEREWLMARRADRALSWPQLSAESGIPAGTLSPFGTNRYAGDNERVAREVFRYRQMVESQAEKAEALQQDPGYFETPTAARLRALLVVAHTGRVTVAATGPGTGKTVAMKEYRESASQVWIATMSPAKKSLNAMLEAVLRAITGKAEGGYGRQMSYQIIETVRRRHGLIVVDEANHLSIESIEELRAIHDETQVGLCLFGNQELLMRIETGRHSDAFGRLNSRIASRLIQNVPLDGDIDAFCDAWGVLEPAMRRFLKRTAIMPGSGGLRECRQIVEQASMLAVDDGRALSLADLRDAQSMRATRLIGE